MFVSAPTANPDSAWVAQQARNFVMHCDGTAEPPTILIRDLDAKFSVAFAAVLKSEGIDVLPVRPRAPNLNAFVER